MALFPESNLLGGFCIFAPFWMVGAPLLAVVTLGWVAQRTVQWLKRKGDRYPEDNSPTDS
jgi:hypothetical protein